MFEVFSSPFSKPFPSAASAAVPWYLSGGIAAANCVAAYQPKGAASLAASYVNLANPGTYNAAPGSAPTWDATNGWQFNGSANYLTTGVIPVNNQTWSVIVRFSNYDTSAANRYLFGVYTANYAGSFSARPYTNATRSDFANGGNKIITGTYTSGALCIAGNLFYANGSVVSGAIPTGGNGFTGAMYIAAINELPGANQLLKGNIQAFAVYNATLSAAQVLAVTNAMNLL